MALKLNVPHFIQGYNECGQTALKMVFAYFGKDIKINEISNAVDPEEKGATTTIGLAKTTAELGFKIGFYTKSIEANPENFKMDFYKRETEGYKKVKAKIDKLKEECEKLGVKIYERALEINEIIGKINKNCIALVLLDWNIVLGRGERGYQGHFVPITGYDNINIYVNNSGDKEGKDFAIPLDVFDKARKAKGTDEDVLFISKR